MKRAVILLSGGLDSATVLAIARSQGFECHALSVAYGQRHVAELEAAARVAAVLGAREHRVMQVGLAGIGGSALTDTRIAIPEARITRGSGTSDSIMPGSGTSAVGTPSAIVSGSGIPVTYVPARNTIMLSLALAWAEVLEAHDLFIGVNAVDYSGYPDCRPEFIAAFERLANLATKAGVEGNALRIHAPLISLSKADIIRKGVRLGVDYGQTVSCYQADEAGRACGHCDSCQIRRQGFLDAGLADATRYRAF